MINVFANLQPMITSLKRLDVKLTDQDEFMEKVGDYFLDCIESEFNRQTDPYGKKWADLSPATIADKVKKGYPLTILTRTKKMRSSAKIIVSSKSVQILLDSPAEYHQSGTRKMPKRQILPEGKLSTTDERNIKDIAVNYLDI